MMAVWWMIDDSMGKKDKSEKGWQKFVLRPRVGV
jgi:hypothetical protein